MEDATLFSFHFAAMLPAACQSLVVEAGLWRLVVALRSTSIALRCLIRIAFSPPWGGRIYESMSGLNETGEQLLLSVTSDIFERTRAAAVALLVDFPRLLTKLSSSLLISALYKPAFEAVSNS